MKSGNWIKITVLAFVFLCCGRVIINRLFASRTPTVKAARSVASSLEENMLTFPAAPVRTLIFYR